MERNDRLGLYESLLDTFLARTREKGYIVIEVLGRPDEYIQFQFHGGRIYGEVGSRQWSEPERPLDPGAVEALSRLGFNGGGPECNYACDGLPARARELARLADTLFHTAYGVADDFDPVMRELNLKDVTMPRARPFTRDMIEEHLRREGVQFLRDQDGDFRVDLHSDEAPGIITVWLVASGPGDTIYTISGSAAGRSQPATRGDALERCNTWNHEFRWPKAFVVGDDAEWRIILGADISLETGVHGELLEEFTRRVVAGIQQFWDWVVPVPADSGPPPPRRRRARRPRTEG